MEKKKRLVRSMIPGLVALSMLGTDRLMAANPGSINKGFTFTAAPYDSNYPQPFKYKIVVSRNGGPASPIFVDANTWTNGLSFVKFDDLEPNSVYNFNVCLVYKDPNNVGKYVESPYIGPNQFATGGIDLANKNSKPVLSVDYPAHTLDGLVSLLGNITSSNNISSLQISGDVKVVGKEYSGSGGNWQSHIELKNIGPNKITISATDYFTNTVQTNITINYVTATPERPTITNASFARGNFRVFPSVPIPGNYTLQRNDNETWKNIESSYPSATIERRPFYLQDTNPPASNAIYRIKVD